jgi:hypothetical protein
MSKKKQTGPPRASAPRTPARVVGEGALMTTRIDPPHQIAAAEPEPPAPQAMPTAGDAAPRVASTARQEPFQPTTFVMPLAQSFEQMQNQAAQLAAQLCKQQATLDHREAEVNARAASVESQVRTARLWLVEKLEELAQRTAELSAAAPGDTPDRSGHAPHGAEQEGQSPRTADATGQADSLDGEPSSLFGTLRFWKQHHWQEEFERWRSARDAASDVSAATAGAFGANDDRTVERSSAQARAVGETERRLAAAERQLASRAAELEALRRDLAAERETLEAERKDFVAERQADLYRLAEQRRAMSENLMRQRARLRRRRDDFDAREMALRQLRAELLRMQQQTLEMRLGAEEQWARQRGKGAAADGPSRADPRNFSGDARREGAA